MRGGGAYGKPWHLSWEISLTSQWHILEGLQKVALETFINCHWLVNDIFKAAVWESVIDQSMTVLEGLQKIALGTFKNCHWLHNDSFKTAFWKVSLTSKWQFLLVSKKKL